VCYRSTMCPKTKGKDLLLYIALVKRERGRLRAFPGYETRLAFSIALGILFGKCRPVDSLGVQEGA
jgi:hypothetical protein